MDTEKKQETTMGKWKEAFMKWIGLSFALLIPVLLFLIVANINYIRQGFFYMIDILRPVIYGCVIAYLLNPLQRLYERGFFALAGYPEKNISKRLEKFFSGLAIVLAMFTGILVIVILCRLVIPQLMDSVVSLIYNLPGQVNYYYDIVTEYIENNKFLESQVQQAALDLTAYMETKMNTEVFPWLRTEILPSVNTFAVEFASGIMGILNVFYNILIGMIVAVYLLNGKRMFAAQAKKMTYGLLKKQHADTLLRYIRISNFTFSGFISGKIVDSTIIGILCFVLMCILKLPYPMLISVIVGVTNVIPVFGPYIGAVPSFLFILLINPIQAIYFLIMIIIVQQLDGNVIGPMILGESTGLSAFWVLFSILIFGKIWGVAGMVVGCPLFAVIYRIIKDIVTMQLKKKDLSTETGDYTDLKAIRVGEKGTYYEKFTKDELLGKKKKDENQDSAFSNFKRKVIEKIQEKKESQKQEEENK